MTEQAGLCQTWSEPKLLIFSRTGSYVCILIFSSFMSLDKAEKKIVKSFGSSKNTKLEDGPYCTISGNEPSSVTLYKTSNESQTFCCNLKNLPLCSLNQRLIFPKWPNNQNTVKKMILNIQIFEILHIYSLIPKDQKKNIICTMDDVRGDFLGPPHGTRNSCFCRVHRAYILALLCSGIQSLCHCRNLVSTNLQCFDILLISG